MRTRLVILAMLATTILCGAFVLHAQDDNQGPLAPPPKFEVKRIPSVPHPGPPPIPEQEIIQRFAANENAMKQALNNYVYTQSVRYEEETDPVGTLSASGDTYFKPDGQRYWRVTKVGTPSLHIQKYSLQDLMAMTAVPTFFLTPDELSNYSFLYAGQQQLDQLNTYVFQVKPKLLSRSKRLFEGAIWVDDHDFTIVRTWGKFELEVEPEGNHLPFTMFETYRENFEDKYWLPTYISAEDEIATSDGTKFPIKLVIRDTNFKRRTDSEASSAAPAAPTTSSPDSSSH